MIQWFIAYALSIDDTRLSHLTEPSQISSNDCKFQCVLWLPWRPCLCTGMATVGLSTALLEHLTVHFWPLESMTALIEHLTVYFDCFTKYIHIIVKLTISWAQGRGFQWKLSKDKGNIFVGSDSCNIILKH